MSAREFTKFMIYHTGFYRWRARRSRVDGGRLLILMYHDIVGDADRDLDAESPSALDFEAHMAFLADRFPIRPLSHAIRDLQDGKLAEDTVAITFDDGYESVYTRAFPVLRRHDAPATVFLLTGWINRELAFWWQELREILRRVKLSGVSPNTLQRALGASVPGRYGSRASLCAAVERVLRPMPDRDRNTAIERLRETFASGSARVGPGHSALNWGQVAELQTAGIEIEAHTHTHPNLREVDDEGAVAEVRRSAEEIQQRAGRRPEGFAYPYGKDLQRYRELAPVLNGCGFRYACTALPGVNARDRAAMELRRLSLPPTRAEYAIGRLVYLGFGRNDAFYAKRAEGSRSAARAKQRRTTRNTAQRNLE